MKYQLNHLKQLIEKRKITLNVKQTKLITASSPTECLLSDNKSRNGKFIVFLFLFQDHCLLGPSNNDERNGIIVTQ